MKKFTINYTVSSGGSVHILAESEEDARNKFNNGNVSVSFPDEGDFELEISNVESEYDIEVKEGNNGTL